MDILFFDEVIDFSSSRQIPFNGEINELEFFIKDVYPVYTQVKYKLNESLGTELKDEWIKIAEKKILELREFYKKYLVNPFQMMKFNFDNNSNSLFRRL